MEAPQVILVCSHCGNRTAFEIRAECSAFIRGVPRMNAYEARIWRILVCLTCLMPALEEDTQVIIEGGTKPIRSSEAKIIYPTVTTHLANLPETIEKKYLEALKVRNISPSSCAVMVGKTLEAACNHEKAQGRTLADKLNDLAKSGRIPQTLAEMAQQLRILRNLGAHDDAGDDVTEQDVPIILQFVEAILEYLYVAPAKVAAVQMRLKKTP